MPTHENLSLRARTKTNNKGTKLQKSLNEEKLKEINRKSTESEDQPKLGEMLREDRFNENDYTGD